MASMAAPPAQTSFPPTAATLCPSGPGNLTAAPGARFPTLGAQPGPGALSPARLLLCICPVQYPLHLSQSPHPPPGASSYLPGSESEDKNLKSHWLNGWVVPLPPTPAQSSDRGDPFKQQWPLVIS